jgi:prepilin-type processing-associated H-X9-DG protein
MRLALLDIPLTLIVILAPLGLCGGECGIPISVGVLISAGFLTVIFLRWAMSPARWTRSVLWLLTLSAFISILALPPALCVSHWGSHERRRHCGRNLEEIGLALKAYRQEHGEFPPACIKDGNGKPIHSWQVLILPYLGCKRLYNSYDFGEPWDGAKNIKLIERRPAVFLCPNGYGYVAVTGAGSAWEGKRAEIEDSPASSNSIIVLEAGDCWKTKWLEPEDLSVTEAAAGIYNPVDKGKPKPPRCIVCAHAFGAHALFADGSVRFLPLGLPQDTLKLLLTGDGDNQIDFDSLGMPRLNVGYPRLYTWLYNAKDSPWRGPIAIATLLAAVSLLLRRPRGRIAGTKAEAKRD